MYDPGKAWTPAIWVAGLCANHYTTEEEDTVYDYMYTFNVAVAAHFHMAKIFLSPENDPMFYILPPLNKQFPE